MRKDIDLTSREWRDLIFEGKNKEYGAYYLRETSNKRHIRAVVIVASLAIFLALLPTVFKFVANILPEREVIDESVKIVDINLDKPDEEVKPDIPEIPQQELIEQVAYVAPEIANVAPPEEQQMTNEELNKTEAVISTQTVEGVKSEVPPEELNTAQQVVEPPAPPKIHTYVPEMPSFPGGNDALMKFLRDNLEYPRVDLEMGTQGTVVIQFTVTSSGDLIDFKVARSLSPGTDAEALRVAKKMPKWSPGRQNGQAVYVSFTLPVRFQFQTQN